MHAIKSFIKKNKQLLFLSTILFLGLVLRLALAPTGYHVDIYSNAGWGKWIYENGTKDFYFNSTWTYSWPTQPPLVSLVYSLAFNLHRFLQDQLIFLGQFIALNRLAPTKFIWLFDFTQWFDDAVTKEIEFQNGQLISIKLFAILSDIFIGLIIYLFAKAAKVKNKLIWPAIYLFSPFSFYLSALWGQYDQFGFLFLILSFLSLKKYFYISPLLFALSISLKPTSLIFVPIYLYFIYLRKPNFKELLISSVLVILVIIKSIDIFSGDKNWLDFLVSDLYRIIFGKAEFRVSTNSYNFWHILIGNKALSQNTQFIFIPAKYWGYLSALILNIFAIKSIKKLNLKNYSLALFIVGMGSWLFMTNMLERYIFAGIVGGLLISIYNPKILKYWFILSIIFAINLYKGWWFPEWINLKPILEYSGGLVGRLLSLVNVVLFFIILKIEKIQPKEGK